MSGILCIPQTEAANPMGGDYLEEFTPPSPTRQLREALTHCTPRGALAPADSPPGPAEATPQSTPERVKSMIAQWQMPHTPAAPQQASTPSSLGGAYVEVNCASVVPGEGAGGNGAQGGSGPASPQPDEFGLTPLGSGTALDQRSGAGDASHNQFSSPLASLTQGTTSTSSTVTASPGRNDQAVVYSKPVPVGPPEEAPGGQQQRRGSGQGTAAVTSPSRDNSMRDPETKRTQSPPLVAMDANGRGQSSSENSISIRNMYMIQEVQAKQAYHGGSGWFAGLMTACDSMCMSFDCFALDVADDWVSTPAKQKAEEWASHTPTTASMMPAPRVRVTEMADE